jgi:hypothetical protein
LLALVGLAALCLILVAVFAHHSLSSAHNIFSVTSMLAICAVLTGGLFGFLFGIPRTLQQDHGSDKAEPSPSGSTYRANTNLEQISDWLTKILLGAGLAEVNRLREWLWSFSRTVAAGFGNDQTLGAVFAATTICSFVLVGFFVAYFWTRFYLAASAAQSVRAACNSLDYGQEFVWIVDNSLRKPNSRGNRPDLPTTEIPDRGTSLW